jgi:Glycosyl transferase family group 2
MTAPVTVSIIIPVKPGGRVRALDGLRALDYPAEAWEVIVAEGRAPSRQRNIATEAAGGKIICFLDDDSLVRPDHLSRLVSHYTDPAVAAVGGPSLTPDTDSVLQHAFGMAFSSLVGGGGMRNRYRQTGGVRATGDRELILCNLSFRRDLLLRLGGFDERLYPNEENLLMERIIQDGRVLIHDPGLAIERSHRPTVRAFCRQLFSYGRGRGEQTVLSGVIKPVTVVPSLFLLYLLLLPLLQKPVYYLPLLCYLGMTVAVSAGAALRTGRLCSSALLPIMLTLFHCCYGAGMVSGLLSPRFRKRGIFTGDVVLKQVKEFGEPMRQGQGNHVEA